MADSQRTLEISPFAAIIKPFTIVLQLSDGLLDKLGKINPITLSDHHVN